MDRSISQSAFGVCVACEGGCSTFPTVFIDDSALVSSESLAKKGFCSWTFLYLGQWT